MLNTQKTIYLERNKYWISKKLQAMLSIGRSTIYCFKLLLPNPRRKEGEASISASAAVAVAPFKILKKSFKLETLSDIFVGRVKFLFLQICKKLASSFDAQTRAHTHWLSNWFTQENELERSSLVEGDEQLDWPNSQACIKWYRVSADYFVWICLKQLTLGPIQPSSPPTIELHGWTDWVTKCFHIPIQK